MDFLSEFKQENLRFFLGSVNVTKIQQSEDNNGRDYSNGVGINPNFFWMIDKWIAITFIAEMLVDSCLYKKKMSL